MVLLFYIVYIYNDCVILEMMTRVLTVGENTAELFSQYSFKEGSKLVPLLQKFWGYENKPLLTEALGYENRVPLALWRIMTGIIDYIREYRLQDPGNAQIVICNEELSRALECGALHCKQIRSMALKQLILVEKETTPPPDCPAHIVQRSRMMGPERDPLRISVLQRQVGLQRNKENWRLPRTLFCLLCPFRRDPGETKNKFSLREACLMFKDFISFYQHTYKVWGNSQVYLIRDTRLEEIFEMGAFHTDQVPGMIMKQLIEIYDDEEDFTPIVHLGELFGDMSVCTDNKR